MEDNTTQKNTEETTASFKSYGHKHHEAVKRQFDTLKPFCFRCMKLDEDKGLGHGLDYYFEQGMRLVQTSEIRDNKNARKIVGWMSDFRCDKGHGTTIRIDKDRGKEAFASKLLNKKDLERAGIEVK